MNRKESLGKRFPQLGSRAQRGSKPRCHLLTHGPRELVAGRLTKLVSPFATVSPTDFWMPEGFVDCSEAELDKAAGLLDPDRRRKLAEWWLPVDRIGARTPNFDIASTCTVEGSPGLLLIEAKAHQQELLKEAAGRVLEDDASDERRATHPAIGKAIDEACRGLSAATGKAWKISRDSHYQISNRFAWSWKLTELGVPVVLVYLGFLEASEMKDRGGLISNDEDWKELVLGHGSGRIPRETWGRAWNLNGQSFVPLIRTAMQSLDHAGDFLSP